MARLSSPIRDLKPHYDVVVVGSGYGGAIAAARFTAALGHRPGWRLCVLEQGREFRPGEFPDTLAGALAELQVDLPDGHLNRRAGLYDLRMNGDVSVIQGCGLGGGSLINAGVALCPDDEVFLDPRWPAALRTDLHHGLRRGFVSATAMLEPDTYPDRLPVPRKVEELQRIHDIARREDGQREDWNRQNPDRELPRPWEGARFGRLPINVTFTARRNAAGVQQQACRLCGDCMSGCNYGAKNTLAMNYLPVARRHGAELFTGVRVTRLERRGERWLIRYEVLDCGRDRFDAPEMFLSADAVVLAAGTLGTAEILLRSRERLEPRFKLSDRLGTGLSVNGDYLAFAWNGARRTNPFGAGRRLPDKVDPVGPLAAAIIDLRRARAGQPLDDGIVVEEGVMAGAVAPIFPALLALAALGAGEAPPAGLARPLGVALRRLGRRVRLDRGGAGGRTLVYLVMGHDGAGGRVELEDDRPVVRWPGAEHQRFVDVIHEYLRPASGWLRAAYVPNTSRLITAHTLGGAGMGEDAGHGVVDHEGCVFNAAKGPPVLPRLYVCDGSVIPRSIGVNPLLTISALAERACVRILAAGGP